MSEHNETPWYANGHVVYMGADGGFSLRCCPNPEANARHIVHCVNNHELVKRKLKTLRDSISGDCYMGEEWELETIDEILAALEAEKGGEL